MKKIKPEYDSEFKVLESTKRSQAAVMVLKGHEKTGGQDNKHKDSDQWLYVVYGRGKAIINEEEIELNTGDLLLIEAGEKHEIINESPEHMQTINIYAPPEY